MKISIFGAGYVGLVTGACFAELGNEVLCCDVDEEKVKELKKGKIPFYELGLEQMVLRNIEKNRLIFSSEIKKAVEFGDILFIAVGTPAGDYGRADLSHIYNVSKSIGENLSADRKIIVIKSTVPVGTAKEVEDIVLGKLRERKADFDFAVVANPEFLKEGGAINDFMNPDRIVVGVSSNWAKEKMEELYFVFIKNNFPLYFMDVPSAEMSKYAANAILAAKISFINQMANLCEMAGADIEEVRRVICADKRIGQHFFYPGAGYGGSCLPKDVQALSALAKKFGYTANLIEAIETVNENQRERLAKKIIKELKNLEGKKIAVWGLSFKPQTSDMREAPSVDIIEKLLSKGADIFVYDPVSIEEAKKIFNKRVEYASNMYECLKNSNALVLITEWPEFKNPDFVKVKNLLANPIIFDGRNIYSPAQMRKFGFKYISVGRPDVDN